MKRLSPTWRFMATPTRSLAFIVFGILAVCCAPAQSADSEPSRGILVNPADGSPTEFMAWTSEDTVHQAVRKLKSKGGGVVSFLPGEYTIHQGIFLNDVNNVTIRGTMGVKLKFAPSPETMPRLTKEVQQGEDFLMVDRPDLLKVGWKYQVYPESLKGDRILEFRVRKVDQDRVWIAPKVQFMGHVKEIPVGSVVFEHLNFFSLTRCDSVTLEGLHLDGIQRGSIHGHTTFCGVLAVGQYKVGERPKNHRLEIKNCSFVGLKGRGIAIYGMGENLVEGCYFRDIDSQAVEI
ncbi:MAG: right-handed parallel beta-helix repeat-containing protein, partial [Planctomycetes bacterium]|nr:right-handed parallel beta-helix repeat-containing protein [Planctomycetota bacterium]